MRTSSFLKGSKLNDVNDEITVSPQIPIDATVSAIKIGKFDSTSLWRIASLVLTYPSRWRDKERHRGANFADMEEARDFIKPPVATPHPKGNKPSTRKEMCTKWYVCAYLFLLIQKWRKKWVNKETLGIQEIWTSLYRDLCTICYMGEVKGAKVILMDRKIGRNKPKSKPSHRSVNQRYCLPLLQ